jgi:hypothetical protein
MIERGHRPCLAAEALTHHGVARLVRLHELQRDGPVESQLARPVEDPNAADAHDALDLVAGEGGAGCQHSD